MDALARLASVARPLVDRVDEQLATLGAPSEHPVWPLLRRVGATPADALAAVAAFDPARLRSLAETVGEPAHAYAREALPVDVEWRGHAADAYAVRAAALDAHQRAGGDGSLVGRLRATAGYLDDVADWQQRSRDRLARALAEVMTSGQAVAVVRPAAGRWPDPDPGAGTGDGAGGLAAAEISVRLLREVTVVLADGEQLRQRWTARLDECEFRPPADAAVGSAERVVEVRH